MKINIQKQNLFSKTKLRFRGHIKLLWQFEFEIFDAK